MNVTDENIENALKAMRSAAIETACTNVLDDCLLTRRDKNAFGLVLLAGSGLVVALILSYQERSLRWLGLAPFLLPVLLINLEAVFRHKCRTYTAGYLTSALLHESLEIIRSDENPNVLQRMQIRLCRSTSDELGRSTHLALSRLEKIEQFSISAEAEIISQRLEELPPWRSPDFSFAVFAAKLRRFSVFNVRLIYMQRRGALAVASQSDWVAIGRTVSSDAVPIVILKPFAPVTYLYELEDTLPAFDRKTVGDPFAVEGFFDPRWLHRIIQNAMRQSFYKIEVRRSRLGFLAAGHVAWQHNEDCVAESNPLPGIERLSAPLPTWRVTLNDKMTEAEQFVTLTHELAHIFCGHLGGCRSKPEQAREFGWQDRSGLEKAEREIEAESVAWIIANRAGLKTESKAYLSLHRPNADMSKVDWEIVARATSRIEKLGEIIFDSQRADARSSEFSF